MTTATPTAIKPCTSADGQHTWKHVRDGVQHMWSMTSKSRTTVGVHRCETCGVVTYTFPSKEKS